MHLEILVYFYYTTCHFKITGRSLLQNCTCSSRVVNIFYFYQIVYKQLRRFHFLQISKSNKYIFLNIYQALPAFGFKSGFVTFLSISCKKLIVSSNYYIDDFKTDNHAIMNYVLVRF